MGGRVVAEEYLGVYREGLRQLAREWGGAAGINLRGYMHSYAPELYERHKRREAGLVRQYEPEPASGEEDCDKEHPCEPANAG